MKTILSLGAVAVRNLILPCAIATAVAQTAFAQADGQSANSRADGTSSALAQSWPYLALAAALLAALVAGVLGFKLWKVGKDPLLEQLRAQLKNLREQLDRAQNKILQLEAAPRDSRPTSAELEVALERAEHRLTRKVQELRDKARAPSTSSSRRVELEASIAKHSEIAESSSASPIEGALPACRAWQDVLRVSRQLANVGLASDARELLQRPDVEGLVKRDPSAMSRLLGGLFSGVDVEKKVVHGCRALECALTWCAVAKCSGNAVEDVARAREWFDVAIKWLPNEQDIDVLLEWVRFERLVDDGTSATEVTRLLTAAQGRVRATSGLSATMQAQVWVESAHHAMDCAGVPRIGVGMERLVAGAPRQAATTTGDPLVECDRLIREAEGAVRDLPSDYRDVPSDYHRQDGRYMPQAGTEAYGDMVRHAPIRFRVRAARVRLEVARQPHAADQMFSEALGEHQPGPSSSIKFVPRANGDEARAALESDWSRLEVAGSQLSASDRWSVQQLRLRWVQLHVDRANSPQAHIPKEQWWRAAWLLCRYWVASDATRLTGEASDHERLEALTKSVLAQLKEPSGDATYMLQDSRVLDELAWRVRTPIKGPIPLLPSVSSLVCRPRLRPGRPGARTIVEEIEVYHISSGNQKPSDLDGLEISLESPPGMPARRTGVFGYPLAKPHVVRIAAGGLQPVGADRVFGPFAEVSGHVWEAGRLTFSGVETPANILGFDLVFRGSNGTEVDRINFDGLAVAGEGQAVAPVDFARLLAHRHDLEEIIAALAIEDVVDGTAQQPMVDLLCDLLEEQLGEHRNRLSEALPNNGCDTPSLLRKERVKMQARDLGARWDRERVACLAYPKFARNQLHQSVHQALVRFVALVQELHPDRLLPEVVAALGLGANPQGGIAPIGGGLVRNYGQFGQDRDLRGDLRLGRDPVDPLGHYRTGVGGEPPASQEVTRAFGELLQGLRALNIENMAWGNARDPMAIRGSVREMLRRISQALSTARENGPLAASLHRLRYDAEDLLRELR